MAYTIEEAKEEVRERLEECVMASDDFRIGDVRTFTAEERHGDKESPCVHVDGVVTGTTPEVTNHVEIYDAYSIEVNRSGELVISWSFPVEESEVEGDE